VRGVRDKPPLRLERRLQTREQAVDRIRQRPELVARAGQIEPAVEVGVRDLLSGGGDRTQRAQHAPGDHPAEQTRDDRHDPERDRGFDLKLAQLGDPLLGFREPQEFLTGG
jgi:hypothetical protein